MNSRFDASGSQRDAPSERLMHCTRAGPTTSANADQGWNCERPAGLLEPGSLLPFTPHPAEGRWQTLPLGQRRSVRTAPSERPAPGPTVWPERDETFLDTVRHTKVNIGRTCSGIANRDAVNHCDRG